MCGDNYLEFGENVLGENCAIENIFFENDSYYWNGKITIGDDNEFHQFPESIYIIQQRVHVNPNQIDIP